MDNREADRVGHPPVCTCVRCVKQRLQKDRWRKERKYREEKEREEKQREGSEKREKERKERDERWSNPSIIPYSSIKKEPHVESKRGGPVKMKSGRDQKGNLPYWLLPLLLVFILSILGLGLSLFASSPVPFWLLLGFSIVFSVERWFSPVIKRSKAVGKLYRLTLNLGILSTLGLLVLSGIELFSGGPTYSPLTGSLIFLAELVFFIWMWKVVSKNSWRWPSMKLTAFSLICLTLVLTFAGVPPISTYKDSLLTNWKEHKVEQEVEQAERDAVRATEQKIQQAEIEAAEIEAAKIETARVEVARIEAARQEQARREAEEEAAWAASLRNPSWEELKVFLLADSTDEMEYVYPTTVCSDFAYRLQKNAKAAGWRCAVVNLGMTGYTDPYNYGIAQDAGHACNAFETSDRGLVYIDCTGPVKGTGPWPPNNDTVAEIQVGEYYNTRYIFPSGGWSIPEDQIGVVRSIDIQW